MKYLRRLFAHYEMYHLHGPLMLKYAGILGALGFPIFYLLRSTKSSTSYDDFWIRGVATLLCLLLLLRNRWPPRLQPYYIAFSYPVLIFSLPVLFVFTSLKNGGGVAAVANTMMVAFFVILITDWRNTIVMLAVGIATGAMLYFALDPNPKFPMDYVGRLPLLILVVIGGSFFKFAGDRATAEKMRQAYASIAGTIAHEMRNPLSQIKHNLEGMQQALPQPTTTAQPQSLEVGQVDALYCHLAQSELAVKRGLQVIGMTLGEVSAKAMDTSAFSYLSAADATRKAIQEYSYDGDVDRERVSVEVVEDFSFRGDETAYLFVLFNLIKNALYYLAFHPDARLKITVEKQQVKVRDTGPGIAPEVMPRLFEAFRSVGKSGGTGLGLAYCKRVMQAFGGQISCESVLGEYTQFTLRFPPVDKAESEAHRAAALAKAQTAFSGKRLLIVDDDATLRALTRHKLQLLGAAIDEAANGQRALELLTRQRYDLLVLDLNMPVIDGYGLAEKIRQGHVPANRDICIVAYTSEPAHVASVKTHKAGMDGFVSKPCAQLPLVQALHHALEHPVGRHHSAQAMLAGRCVLLADDNPYNRKAVAAYLKHAGMRVVEAAHGQEVLAQLAGQAGCDAVVMDINMPGMSGVDTARAIRAGTDAFRDVPILALTAHSDQDTMEAARAAGMGAFITKPVDAAQLYEKLCRLMGLDIVSAPQAPAVAAPRPEPSGTGIPLLNPERLESYRRIGMLDELLTDYFREAARLVDKLDRGAARRDLQESLDALHSLLGMSGEAGATALYQAVRTVYVPMVEEGHWPATGGWVEHLKELALRTDQALKEYGHVHSAVPEI